MDKSNDFAFSFSILVENEVEVEVEVEVEESKNIFYFSMDNFYRFDIVINFFHNYFDYCIDFMLVLLYYYSYNLLRCCSIVYIFFPFSPI